MKLRPAVLEDDAPIASLAARVSPHPWSSASVRTSLALPTTHAWVLERDGAFAGHLISTVLFERAEVLLVAVLPELHGRGLGRQLMLHAAGRWRALGATEGALEVRHDNAPARHLYESLGWQAGRTRPAYYTDGTDAVEYSVTL